MNAWVFSVLTFMAQLIATPLLAVMAFDLGASPWLVIILTVAIASHMGVSLSDILEQGRKL